MNKTLVLLLALTGTAHVAWGACSPTPLTCVELASGSFTITNSTKPGKDTVRYKAGKGNTTGVAALFGNPTTVTDNALCVYNSTSLIFGLDVAAAQLTLKGKPAWRITSKGATKFAHTGNAAGVTSVSQKPGKIATVSWAAGKANLVIPALPLMSPPIVVQNQISGGACVETIFRQGDVGKNDGTRFFARTSSHKLPKAIWDVSNWDEVKWNP